MDKRSKYTPAAFAKIMEYWAKGMTLKDICAKYDWAPDNVGTVYEWRDRTPENTELYVRAQHLKADNLADESLQISDGRGDPQRDRLRVETRKWAASRFNPRKYGEKLDLTVETKLDLKGALEAAKQRIALPERDQSDVIDAEYTDIIDVSLPAPTDTKSVDTPETTEDDDDYPDFLD